MLGKDDIYFSYKYELPFCQKSKDYVFLENTPKDEIPGITEKNDIHLREDDIAILDRQELQ